MFLIVHQKFLLIALFISIIVMGNNEQLHAQAPQSFSYQCVVRSANGAVIPNQLVRFRFSIRELTAAGAVIYQETQTSTSNGMGLVNLFVGQGSVVAGQFSAIDWGAGDKFLQVELDPSGGTTFLSVGTQQLVSVPYALMAGQLNTSSSSSADIRRLKTKSYISRSF